MDIAVDFKYGVDLLVYIPVDNIKLEGKLVIPPDTKRIVIFSHGSGSSRHSPRNNFVAKQLQDKHVGTLLIDLLTSEEDEYYESRFDIDLLTQRLIGITEWVAEQPDMMNFKMGYFGSSTGAASALRAAAELGPLVKTVVSRGGRPDLAMDVLEKVEASVLLIVGELDWPVLELNRQAYQKLYTHKKLDVVPGASHLFEEPGALEKVAHIAAAWYDEQLIHE